MAQHSTSTQFPEYAQNTEESSSLPHYDTLLTVREVAQRLRVDTTTVRRWIAQGILEAVSLPHHGKRRVYRVRQQTLDHLIHTESAPK